MKNTMQPDINKYAYSIKKIPWKALPLLFATFIQGIPIAGGIQEQSAKFAEQIFEETQARATTIGYENTVIYALFWGTLYLFSALMLMHKPRFSIAILLRFWPLMLMVVFMIASLLWVAYPEKVSINIVHNVGVIFIALAAAIHYRHNPVMLPIGVGVALGLNLVIHLVVIIVLPSVTMSLDGRWQGFTSNPNSFGAISFCAFWANVVAVTLTKRIKRFFHLLFSALAVVGMLGAESMTSIITSMVAISGFYFIGVYGENKRFGLIRISALLRFTISTAILLLVVFILIYGIWVTPLFDLVNRSSDISGRTYIWEKAFLAFSQQPIIGWGFDDNAQVNQITGMVHSTYHNGYLDLLVRGGIIGLLLYLMTLVICVRNLIKARQRLPYLMPIILPFILAISIYNITEVSLFAPRNILWIFLLVIFFLPVTVTFKKRAKRWHEVNLMSIKQ